MCANNGEGRAKVADEPAKEAPACANTGEGRAEVQGSARRREPLADARGSPKKQPLRGYFFFPLLTIR